MYKLFKRPLRDRDMPISNRARYLRWKLKKEFLTKHPGIIFPVEFYAKGD